MKTKFTLPVGKAMKLSTTQTLIFLLFSSFSFANFTSSQILDEKVSVNWNSVNLEQALHTLEGKLSVHFVYSGNTIPSAAEVTLKASNVKLREVLEEILSPRNISWGVNKNFIILKKKKKEPEPERARSGGLFSKPKPVSQTNLRFEVSGTVRDETGESVIGASILEKGTTNGTLSGVDGKFEITVESGDAVLLVSFIGMATKEIPVANQSILEITLAADAVALDQVVAIGYASDRKQDLSVAVSNVEIDETFKGRPATLGNILQGQMPGVNIIQSGAPGSTPEISIRGRGNRDGDGVLFVVDGVPNAPFHPSDVESVSVLKDAASAAIYGAYAGSGGVILITTKKAKAEKISVQANIWGGYQEAWRLPEVLTTPQFNKVWADASNAAGRPIPSAYDPLQFPYGNITRTDWIDAVFRKGRMQHYDVTVQGGTEKQKTLFSFAYDHNEGSLLNTWNKVLSTRLNTELKLAPWVTFSQQLQYKNSNGQSSTGDGHTGVIFGAMAYPRFASVYEYDAAGNILPGGTIPRWALAQGYSVEADLFNPVTSLLNSRQNNPRNELFSNSRLILTPIKGLRFHSDFSYILDTYRSENFTKRFTAPGRTVDQNFRSIYNHLKTNWNWENIASYDLDIGPKHTFNIVGGITMNYTNFRSNGTNTQGYDFEEPHYTIFTNAQDWAYARPSEEIWEESLFSALGRVSYSYDDRYFFTASIRRDASSKLSPKNNYDVFPAMSGAWKISSEPFFQNEAISLLKLRASWGQVGNVRSVRRFVYAPPYSLGQYGLFLGENTENHVYGIFQSTIPNPKLKWERTEQTDIGLDIGLFKNRFDLSIDYFYKKTKDLIEPLPIPSVAGVASPPETNIGEVENHGLEFSFDYFKNFRKSSLNLKGNIGFVRNKVINIGERTSIAHSIDINSMKPLQSTLGQPWYSYYLIKADGLFKSVEEVNNYTWTDPSTNETRLVQPNAKPGDIRFVDVNNDGLINDGDRQYMGAYDFPKFSYGFTAGFNWNNFSISMFWQGIAGVKAFNGVKAMASSGLKGWNMTTEILKSYEYDPNSGVPRLSLIDDPNGNYSRVSSYFLDKADYLRLKNLNVSYTVPDPVLNKIGMSGKEVRLYFNADNPITFTKYSSFDPEIGNFGVDEGRFPVSRMYSLGINVSL